MKQRVLVVAHPNSGILDNIFPMIFTLDRTVFEFDVLMKSSQLARLCNNKFLQDQSFAIFDSWIIETEETKELSKYSNRLVKLWSRLDFLGTIRDKMLNLFGGKQSTPINYDHLITDIYIYSRSDVKRFIDVMKSDHLISISHALNPFGNENGHDYLFPYPQKVDYIEIARSQASSYGLNDVNVHDHIGLMKHHSFWQKKFRNPKPGKPYILLVSRPPDGQVLLKDEMIGYYQAMLEFAKRKGLRIVAKPHLWEEKEHLANRLQRVNKAIGAKIDVSSENLNTLIANCEFGLMFYSGVGADFVINNRVLIQCACPDRLNRPALNRPFQEPLVGNPDQFEDVASKVLSEPEKFLAPMRETYDRLLIAPTDQSASEFAKLFD